MRARTATLALVAALPLLILPALPAGGAAAAPEPVVQGNRILDASTGRVFVPRGVNWPSFEYACQQGWGYSNDGATAATAEAMAGWRINTVRLPLNQDCWLGDDGLPALGLSVAGYRAALRSFVHALNQHGIVVVLDLHWSGPEGVEADGLRPLPDQRSDDFWSSVAASYADEPSVIFDAFNEPHSRWDEGTGAWAFQLTWDCWRDGDCLVPAQKDTETVFDGSSYPALGLGDMVAAIRGAGAGQPIILGGRRYANDLDGWLEAAPADDQLIAGFHGYLYNACADEACWDAEVAPVAARAPVVLGEFGGMDCTGDFMERAMDWADAHGIGYLAWAWWVIDEPGCGAEADWALIEDLDGTPRAPYGTTLKAHLEEASSPPLEQPPGPGPVPDPPPGPNPGPEPRGKLGPRLRIVSALRGGRRVVVKARLRAAAARKLELGVVYRLGGERVVRTRGVRPAKGLAVARFTLAPKVRAVRATAAYPGDPGHLPATRAAAVQRRPRGLPD